MENSLNNLPPFYVGQKVVCVKTHPYDLVIKGQTYKIKYIRKHPCCGVWVVDVGTTTSVSFTGIKCVCGAELPYSDEVLAARLMPIQQSNFPLMTFIAIKEKEKEQALIPN